MKKLILIFNVILSFNLYSQVYLDYNCVKINPYCYECHYGLDNRQYYIINLLPGWIQKDLVIFVHGGAFIGGNINNFEDLKIKVLNMGYSIVLMEYRICPDVIWPIPVDDINNGIIHLISLIDEYNFSGDIICVGSSAGANALTLILYANRYGDHNILKFISFSGVYNPLSMIYSFQTSIELCDMDVYGYSNYDIEKNTPALLIEGYYDGTDYSPCSNILYLSNVLNNNNIEVIEYCIEEENCGHLCPFLKWVDGDILVNELINNFLKD